jgi:hypothetical protein
VLGHLSSGGVPWSSRGTSCPFRCPPIRTASGRGRFRRPCHAAQTSGSGAPYRLPRRRGRNVDAEWVCAPGGLLGPAGRPIRSRPCRLSPNGPRDRLWRYSSRPSEIMHSGQRGQPTAGGSLRMSPSQHIEDCADQLRERAVVRKGLILVEVVHDAVFVRMGDLRSE